MVCPSQRRVQQVTAGRVISWMEKPAAPPGPQAQLLHAPGKLPEPFLQHGQQLRHLAAAGKVPGDLLRAKAHGLELFDLQNTGHIVIVVVPPSAVRRDVGGSQQALFLHTQERTAGKTAGMSRLGNLKERSRILFHSKIS